MARPRIAPVQPTSRTARRCSTVAMPADAMISPRPRTDEPLVEREIRAVQQAVALDGRGLERRHARVVRAVGRPRPASTPTASVAQPWPTARPPRTSIATAIRLGPVVRDEATGERGVTQGRGPDHDATGAGLDDVAPRTSWSRRPPATSTRTRSPIAAMMPPDHRPVDRHARAGAVEIDDVQPSRARVDEPLRDGDRVVARTPSRARSRPARGGRRGRRGGRSPAGSRTRLPTAATPC